MLCRQKNKLKLNSLYQWNIYRHYKYHADIITDKGNDQSTHKSSIKCVIVQNNIDRFKKFIPVTIKLFNSDVKLENNIFQAFLWEKKKCNSHRFAFSKCKLFQKQTRALLIDMSNSTFRKRLDYLLPRVEKYTKCL